MSKNRILAVAALGAALLTGVTALAHDHVDHKVLVVGSTAAAIHDLATGQEHLRIDLPGGGLDPMALSHGVALFNHTGGNSVIAVDLRTNAEIRRIPSSTMGGTRPVHSYITPALAGRQFYVALNDGLESRTRPGDRPTDSTATFIDVVPTSPTYLSAIGEVRLGVGHHKAGFSTRRPRFVVSNISDCSDVFSVYDFSNPAEITLVKTFSAADLGFDGSSALKTCDLTGRAGVRLSPHGVGTSAATGEVYHFITGTGQIAVFDIDADTPTVTLVATSGTGGTTVKDQPGGAILLVPQRTPREVQLGAGGAVCQVGQVAVLEARGRQLIAQIPVFAGDATCRQPLAQFPVRATATVPGYIGFSRDGLTAFIAGGTLGGRENADATTDELFVVDVSTPHSPRQLPSIRLQAGQSRDATVAGGGDLLLLANSSAASFSVVDMTKRTAIHVPTVQGPTRIASWSPTSGASKPNGPASPAIR